MWSYHCSIMLDESNYYYQTNLVFFAITNWLRCFYFNCNLTSAQHIRSYAPFSRIKLFLYKFTGPAWRALKYIHQLSRKKFETSKRMIKHSEMPFFYFRKERKFLKDLTIPRKLLFNGNSESIKARIWCYKILAIKPNWSPQSKYFAMRA